MKKITVLLASLLLLAGVSLQAQKVTTEPEVYTDPTDTLKIIIDLTQMDCDKLVGTTDPLYIWSWMPAEPVNGNGDWDASNLDNAWVNEGPDIWSFKMVPTEFYGVTAQEVYDNDIFFLVKAEDGGSGGDCSAAGDEFKTEDLTVEVDPPASPVQKVKSFPAVADGDSLFSTQDDIFSLVYDNSQEEKPTMIDPGDLYVYARAYDTDGDEYKPSAISQVGSNPDLMMTQDGSIYRWIIWPAKLFDIPAGKTLEYVNLQIVKPVITNTDDAVDGNWVYYFRCQ